MVTEPLWKTVPVADFTADHTPADIVVLAARGVITVLAALRVTLEVTLVIPNSP